MLIYVTWSHFVQKTLQVKKRFGANFPSIFHTIFFMIFEHSCFGNNFMLINTISNQSITHYIDQQDIPNAKILIYILCLPHTNSRLPTTIPANWRNFLCVDANKDALFQLASAIQELQSPDGNELFSPTVKMLYHLQNMTSHEETDTQLLFHTFHHGLFNMIQATDTDVVLAIAVFWSWFYSKIHLIAAE